MLNIQIWRLRSRLTPITARTDSNLPIDRKHHALSANIASHMTVAMSLWILSLPAQLAAVLSVMRSKIHD